MIQEVKRTIFRLWEQKQNMRQISYLIRKDQYQMVKVLFQQCIRKCYQNIKLKLVKMH